MELQVLFSGVPYTGTLPQGERCSLRRIPAGPARARCSCAPGHDDRQARPRAQGRWRRAPCASSPSVRWACPARCRWPPAARHTRSCARIFSAVRRKAAAGGRHGHQRKTTVTTLIKQTLEQAGCKAGLIGTIHTEIDAMDVPAKYTTPEPWDLNALFSRMVLAGCTFAVMEASSQALDQLRLWGPYLEVGVFTNLTQDHLDYHKTFENYFAAKKKPVQPGEAHGGEPGRQLRPPPAGRGAGAGAHHLFRGRRRGGLHRPQHPALGLGREVRDGGPRLHPAHRFPMPGDYSVHNALAAAAAAIALGIPARDAAAALRPPAGCAAGARCCITARSPSCATMPTRATPLKKRCSRALRLSWRGGWWCCMAARASAMQKKRPLMSEAVVKYADFAVLTSDNPHKEDRCAIIKDAEPVLAASGKPYIVEVERRTAVNRALDMLRPGDVLALCGKGPRGLPGHRRGDPLSGRTQDRPRVAGAQRAGQSLTPPGEYSEHGGLYMQPVLSSVLLRGLGALAGGPGDRVGGDGQPGGRAGEPVRVHQGRARGRPRLRAPGAGGRSGGRCGAAPGAGRAAGEMRAGAGRAGCDDPAGRELPRAVQPVAGGRDGQRGQTTTKRVLLRGIFGFRQNAQDTGETRTTRSACRTRCSAWTKSVEYAVVEMGMQGLGEIRKLTLAAKPAGAVITCIGRSHLEQLGTRKISSGQSWRSARGCRRARRWW